jgi:succinoglycan biosynthesis protein ExoA
MSTPTPFVTIAIACQDDEARIEAVVRTAQAQDWPADRLEIVVADGMSMDSTREVLARLAEGDARIALVDNHGRTRASGLNECIRRARGELVVRLDPGADCAPDFVRRCVDALAERDVDNVGGAARPRGRTFLQRCVAAALRSPLGVDAASGTDEGGEGWSEGVRPAAFRREVFERVGLYDPRAEGDEQAELGRRITAAGGRVHRSGDIVADFDPRESLRSLARTSFRYGRGRARTMLKHGRFSALGPALPLLWMLGEAALAAASPRRAFPLSMAAYALATGAEAVRVGRREGALAVPVVWALFPVLHAAHGAGFAAGLARYVLRPDWAPSEKLAHAEEPMHAAPVVP